MIKEEYKNGCRLKEQVKYNIDYDDCQILNLTCANYIYDLVQESSKYETKLEDVKKMLYMIKKLLGHEVQYDIPEYHGDNKKCYFGVVSDNFVINEDNIKQLDYVLQDTKATQNAPIIKNTLGEFNRLQIVKTSQQKKQSEALNHYTFDGTSVFDTDNIKPTWVYKETWYDSNGNPAYAEKTGTQYQRPANVKMGFYYFDTSLNKPIWKNSDTENVWIDATGATV